MYSASQDTQAPHAHAWGGRPVQAHTEQVYTDAHGAGILRPGPTPTGSKGPAAAHGRRRGPGEPLGAEAAEGRPRAGEGGGGARGCGALHAECAGERKDLQIRPKDLLLRFVWRRPRC